MSPEVASKENSFLSVCKHIWTNYSIIIVTIVIFIISGIIEPRFLTAANMLLVLRHAAIMGMMALGMTFVIIAGGIDLSAGHVAAASGTVLIMLQGNEAVPIWVAILACFGVAMFVGLFNGAMITKFRLPPFIVTLAVGLMIRSFAVHLVGGRTVVGRRIPAFAAIGSGTIGPIPTPLILWIIMAVALGCILAYTKFGSYVYAVGGNETAASYSGIPVNRIRIICYVLMGFCVGMSTLINFSRMAAITTVTAASFYEFDAITAVIVGGATLAGGRGKIIGTFFGVIIVNVVSNLTIMFGISPYLIGFVKGALILFAILIQRRD